MPLFSVFLSVFFLYVWAGDVKKAFRFKEAFWKSFAVQFALKALILLPLVTLAVNYFSPKNPLAPADSTILIFSILLSAAISFVWFQYLRWIDVFEPERKRFLFLAFLLSCVSIFLVFPLTNVIQQFGYTLDGEPLNDFLYCFIGIGMVEELVKLLPLLFIILFTKQINEPLDYVIYAATSALGFAFVENILYLSSTSLTALSGRLLYASVAHMFFATCIAYPLALHKIRTGKKVNAFVLLQGFLVAALAHGFYDFWLINVQVNAAIITTIFFLGSLHMFTLMKNNLINLSDFYSDGVRINLNKLKYDLIWYILLVIYGGYFLYAIAFGSEAANALLLSTAIFHVSTVIYIAITFSSINYVRGYTLPIFFPAKFFLPKIDSSPDFTGSRVEVTFVKRLPFRKPLFLDESALGKLTNRVVLEGDFNWYFLRDERNGKAYLAKHKDFSTDLNPDSFTKMLLVELKNQAELPKIMYTKKDALRAISGLAKTVLVD